LSEGPRPTHATFHIRESNGNGTCSTRLSADTDTDTNADTRVYDTLNLGRLTSDSVETDLWIAVKSLMDVRAALGGV
jgi:hypothetical protein